MIALTLSCQSVKEKEDMMTFEEDLEFLKKHTETILLSDQASQAQIIVSPGMQGRVLTSTASGKDGMSFGWINYEHILSGERDPHFNPFGGEDRFWLGPEGGQYSIYFEKDHSFELDNWYVPPEIDWENWEIVDKSKSSVRFEKEMTLKNYSGFTFHLKVNRTIRMLEKKDMLKELDLDESLSVPSVAFKSENSITNTGDQTWEKNKGLLSIWILGMFRPSPETTIVVPFKQGPTEELGPIVNDEYFGKISEDRLVIKDSIIYFKGDGKQRSKIGIPPKRCLYIAGSYNAKDQVLTVVVMTPPEEPEQHSYVNSLWKIQEDPYGGDVINSYNDGPSEPGKDPMGPFYELESSSPGAPLGPGESITHCHTTVHFRGQEEDLDKITRKLFNLSLEEIKSVFSN